MGSRCATIGRNPLRCGVIALVLGSAGCMAPSSEMALPAPSCAGAAMPMPAPAQVNTVATWGPPKPRAGEPGYVSARASGSDGVLRALPQPCVPCPCPREAIVFVADGAGGFEGTSDRLREVIAEQRLSLKVRTVDWTHGYLRAFADHLDRQHSLTEAKFLAGDIATLLRSEPRPAIYLLGHSAGTGVILPALQFLPADSVERIILLAPAVSSDYELRPALRCARGGVEVFYSDRDRFILGWGTDVFGTTDRRRDSPAAGRVGFRPPVLSAEEQGLIYRLHQHPWDPSMAAYGNRGGHYGSYEPAFLRSYILPLMR